jgi:hypothetical protein
VHAGIRPDAALNEVNLQGFGIFVTGNGTRDTASWRHLRMAFPRRYRFCHEH